MSRWLPLLLLLGACRKREPDPDHPIQRAELAIVSTPPIAASVPSVVRPGDKVTPISLTNGIAIAIKLEVFQDGNAVAANISSSDTKTFAIHDRSGGYVLAGGAAGNANIVIRVERAAAALEIPVVVKEQ